MRLLFAEDDRHLLTSISRGLREASHDVDQAANGNQALSLALANDYDGIILDVLLPGKSGIEVCRAIRASDMASQPTMIAVTGWGRTDDIERTKKAGFDQHLVKPVKPDQLLALLEACATRLKQQA